MIDAFRVTLAAEDDFDGWRDAARGLAEAGVPAQAIVWQVREERHMCAADSHRGPGPSLRRPRAFMTWPRRRSQPDTERCALI